MVSGTIGYLKRVYRKLDERCAVCGGDDVDQEMRQGAVKETVCNDCGQRNLGNKPPGTLID